MTTKRFIVQKCINRVLHSDIIDISLYHYLTIECSLTGKKRTVIYILALLTAIVLPISIIFFLSDPYLLNQSIMFFSALFFELFTTVIFLFKIYRQNLYEGLFIASEFIIITAVLLNNAPDSPVIYKTAMLIIPIIMLGSALFSRSRWFIFHSSVLILFIVLTYSFRKSVPPLSRSSTAGDVYNSSLPMFIYVFIMLICLRILFGELLKRLKLLFIDNTGLSITDCECNKGIVNSLMH